MDGVPNLPVGLGDDPISAIIGLLVLIVMIPFLLLAVIAGLEFLLLLLVLPFALVGRALFGRHWVVEARKGFRIWWDAPSSLWLFPPAPATRAVRLPSLEPSTGQWQRSR